MTSPKVARDGFAEDLSIRARRLALSASEQALLLRACQASGTLRVAHEVGCDFDRISTVRTGDEQLIARSADAALARMGARRRRSRRWGWAFGIAAALLTSGAGAFLVGVGRSRPTASIARPDPLAGPRLEHGASQEPGSARREPLPLGADSRAGAAEPAAPAAVANHLREPASPTPSRGGERATGTDDSVEIPGPRLDTAADIFRRANAARRAGDRALAGSLYAGLQAGFPDSDEARLSRVSLGKLLLASGGALEAERQFSLYLAQGGRELAEEALVGRAESLDRLGRPAEERQAWQKLLESFPSSVYAARARQRLEELGTGRP
jgi:TolA-binding protein